MPPLGASARAEQLATVARIAHDRSTAPELGSLLEELRELEEGSERESFEASVVRVARRDYEKKRGVPSDLRAEMTRAGSLGYTAWLEARAAADYEIFRPHLERRIALAQEYVACHEPFDDPYDPLLDDHERGMRTADVAAVFARLKAVLVPLVAGIGVPVDDSCLHGDFSLERQREFSLEVLSRWGMDDQAWRLDDTVHPFAMGMSESDIRLTTRFDRANLGGLLSCLHEFGHGIYERQVDARYLRTPLQEGTSSASTSRRADCGRTSWGVASRPGASSTRDSRRRSRNSSRAVPLDEFHRALNRVAPGSIRVDADEVTYSLHIVLRFELEREMLAGDRDSVRPAGRVRREASRVPGSRARERPRGCAAGRPLVGLQLRLLPDLRARERHLDPAVGARDGRARRSRRGVRARRVRLAARVAARARSPLGSRLRAGGAARACRGRAARRRSRTSPISAARSRRSTSA